MKKINTYAKKKIFVLTKLQHDIRFKFFYKDFLKILPIFMLTNT